jgi:predicted acylesterase/phospholipase RssA
MSNDNRVENVLVLQGGGSLGAFGCGVYKALAQQKIKVDIVSGTSIGGVNAAIIAGCRNNRPEEELENFWLELAEHSVDLSMLKASIPASLGNTNSDSPFSDYYQQASNSEKYSFVLQLTRIRK